MPYGMVIAFLSSVAALLDSTRPPSSVVLAPNVAAPGSTIMVPKNTFVAPIETAEAAPVEIQNILVLPAFAVPPKLTVTPGAEVNAPVEMKMYTPGLTKVRMTGELTDIAAATQYMPG